MRTSLIVLAISSALAAGCQSVETTQQGAVGVDRKQHMLVSEQEVEAVSYTHLTLPTIYSV